MSPDQTESTSPASVRVLRKELGLVVLVACVFTVIHQFPMLTDYYSLDDDARIMFFVYRDHDPDLFTVDYTAGGMNRHAPWLVSRFYTAATYFMSPVTYSKLIPFLQIPLAASLFLVFAYRSGWGRRGAWIAVFVFLLVCRWDQFYTGSWRGFAAPLIAGYVVLAQERRWILCGLLGALTVVVYPVLLSAMTATSLLLLAGEAWRAPAERLGVYAKTAGAVAGIGILSAAVALFVIRYGSIYQVMTYEQVISMAETNIGGRFPIADYLNNSPSNVFTLSFLHRMFFLGRTYVAPGFGTLFSLWAGLIVCALAARRFEYRGRYGQARAVRTLLLLAAAAVMTAGIWSSHLENLAGGLYLVTVSVAILVTGSHGLWDLAGRVPKLFALGAFLCGTGIFLLHPWISLKLYTASHQFRYVIPVMVCLAAGRILGAAWERRMVLAPRLTLGAFAAISITGLYHGEVADYVRCEDVPLYEYVSTLPKDTVVAGHPEAADCVPIYTKRHVLIMYELSWPLFADAWEDLKQRTYDIFGALFAADREGIRPFCMKYPGAYIFALDRYLSEGYLSQPVPYFKPFDVYLKQFRGGHAWLLDPPQEVLLKSWEGGRITSCPLLFPDLAAEAGDHPEQP